MDRYDTTRVLLGLQDIVLGRGRVVARDGLPDGRLDAILVPEGDEHTPVVVRIFADVCRLTFGSGSSDSFGYGGVDDEDIVLDAVRAIVSGHAWERFVLDDDGLHVLPRIVGTLHETVAGGDDLDVAYERRVPAWPPMS
ncbi:MAG: hypothetical protein J7518_11125 [Nocardioidaceae bacterium]|nr:hypothetical protein [Nocardioidaceae bacterium]